MIRTKYGANLGVQQSTVMAASVYLSPSSGNEPFSLINFEPLDRTLLT